MTMKEINLLGGYGCLSSMFCRYRSLLALQWMRLDVVGTTAIALHFKMGR